MKSFRQNGAFVGSNPGTDVMIFSNIFAENNGEKIGVFDQKS
jgi:hypothetical protein